MAVGLVGWRVCRDDGIVAFQVKEIGDDGLAGRPCSDVGVIDRISDLCAGLQGLTRRRVGRLGDGYHKKVEWITELEKVVLRHGIRDRQLKGVEQGWEVELDGIGDERSRFGHFGRDLDLEGNVPARRRPHVAHGAGIDVAAAHLLPARAGVSRIVGQGLGQDDVGCHVMARVAVVDRIDQVCAQRNADHRTGVFAGPHVRIGDLVKDLDLVQEGRGHAHGGGKVGPVRHEADARWGRIGLVLIAALYRGDGLRPG